MDDDGRRRRRPLVVRGALALIVAAVIGLGLLENRPWVSSGDHDAPGGGHRSASAAAPAHAATPRPDQADDGSVPLPPLAGRLVVVDPGHNGGNAAAPGTIGKPVPDGRGGTKACNTVGTATNDGYPEHAFAWDVGLRVRAELEALGAVVVLTRDSDDGVGPCVDSRGALAEQVDADLLVSLHGNGTADPSARGYFAIVADPPLDDAQGAPSVDLARSILDALDAAGFAPSSAYPGALSLRSDVAGLNQATRPATMLELGEMRNAEEAAVMASEEGRRRYAEAIVAGITEWLAVH